MAKNLDIIKKAMRKLHVLASGAQPTSAQAADGMDALQSMIVELIGQGSLGRLQDVLATADYTAREFDRIRCDGLKLVTEDGTIITDESGNPIFSTSITVTLPWVITPNMYSGCDYGWRGYYGSFLCCNKPRPPRDRAPVVVIDQTGKNYTSMYSAYLGKWILLNNLEQQGDFPLANYLEDGFAAMLAERIADDYDAALGPNTARSAALCRSMLSLKLDSERATTRAAYF